VLASKGVCNYTCLRSCGQQCPAPGVPQIKQELHCLESVVMGNDSVSPDAEYELFCGQAQQLLAGKAKPVGSLGLLETMACRLAGLQRSLQPQVQRARLIVFAADHGITKAMPGVSAFPREVSVSVFKTIARGQAASSVMCAADGCELELIDVGIDLEEGVKAVVDNASPASKCGRDAHNISVVYDSKVRNGSRNMLAGAAMTPEECEAAMRVGAEAVHRASTVQAPNNSSVHGASADGASAAHALNGSSHSQTQPEPSVPSSTSSNAAPLLLCLGELGIGNTTAAAALLAALTGASPADVCGRGTGLDDAGLQVKQDAVAAALQANTALVQSGCALQALQAVGGLELAAMAGACLEAEKLNIPVVVDGFISGAAALAAVRHNPGVRRVLFLSHRSAERGAAILIAALQGSSTSCESNHLPPPVLDLQMRLGEGTGALLMVPLLKAACSIMNMASLADALS